MGMAGPLTQKDKLRLAHELTMGRFDRLYDHNPCGIATDEWPICYHGATCASGRVCGAARRAGFLKIRGLDARNQVN